MVLSARNSADVAVVDESHRLRKRMNLGAYFRAFDIVNEKLGFLKDIGDELDWVLKQSSKNILFYDTGQSIKPSDVNGQKFKKQSFNKECQTKVSTSFKRWQRLCVIHRPPTTG